MGIGASYFRTAPNVTLTGDDVSALLGLLLNPIEPPHSCNPACETT